MGANLDWNRRGTLGGLLGAGLAANYLAGCASPATPPPPLVSVNLAGETPPVLDDGALLETAFDQALRMTVPIYLNGKGPFAFVIDTGANSSVVSSEVATFVGLPGAGVAPMHGIAGEQPANQVRVRRLRVGGVLSSNLKLPQLTRERLGADGLLGVDVLRNRLIRLDFHNNSFQIGPSDIGPTIGPGRNSRLPPLDGPVTVPARFRFGQLVILDAEAAGRPVIAFIDSGSQVTVGNRALRNAILASRPQIAERVIHKELLSATGQRAEADFAALPGLRLGGQLIDGLIAAFADLHIFDLWDLREQPAILIGVDVLRHFDQVVIDYGRKQVSFWSPHAARAPHR